MRSSFKPKIKKSTIKCVELLHMDICGPIRVRSRGRKMYVFVIIDNFSTFTWTLFLASKEVSFETLTIFFKKIVKTLGLSLISIKYDHGT